MKKLVILTLALLMIVSTAFAAVVSPTGEAMVPETSIDTENAVSQDERVVFQETKDESKKLVEDMMAKVQESLGLADTGAAISIKPTVSVLKVAATPAADATGTVVKPTIKMLNAVGSKASTARAFGNSLATVSVFAMPDFTVDEALVAAVDEAIAEAMANGATEEEAYAALADNDILYVIIEMPIGQALADYLTENDAIAIYGYQDGDDIYTCEVEYKFVEKEEEENKLYVQFKMPVKVLAAAQGNASFIDFEIINEDGTEIIEFD